MKTNTINYTSHFRRRTKCAISDTLRELREHSIDFTFETSELTQPGCWNQTRITADCAGKSITIEIVSISRSKYNHNRFPKLLYAASIGYLYFHYQTNSHDTLNKLELLSVWIIQTKNTAPNNDTLCVTKRNFENLMLPVRSVLIRALSL